MDPIPTLGCDHVDLSVIDLPRSIVFYETILATLGFRRVPHAEYVAWASAHMMVGLRATTTPGAFDRYRVGLHHLALRAAKRADIDRFHAFLVERDVTVLDPPREYPQYGPGYYAVFFADPDGMKLELVHMPWGYWKRAMTDGADSRPRA